MHYVIGDVHGCFDELMMLLWKIEAQDENARFIFVGDFIDRGKKVWETLTWAMENIKNDPEAKYRSVLGNHEDMANDWMFHYGDWLYSGKSGMEPHYHYDFDRVLKLNHPSYQKNGVFSNEDFEPFQNFIMNLPANILVEVETVWGKKVPFRIAHSWHDVKARDKFREKQSNIWERVYSGYRGNPGEILVHGHTPTAVTEYYLSGESCTRPGLIGYRYMDVNVDGGCVFWNDESIFPLMLCAIRLEDLEEFYPMTIEERFREMSGGKRKLREYEKQFPDITHCGARERILKIMGKQ